MNLTDQEILELTALCGALADESITDAERQRLSTWLLESEAARQFYVRMMGQSASLCHYAAELQLEEPDAPAANAVAPAPGLAAGWWAAVFAAAAGIFLVLWFRTPPERLAEATEAKSVEAVAHFTGSNGCEWASPATAPRLGDSLRKGQRLELVRGFAEVTFDSGAQVTLHGPASLDLNSPWDGTLRRGALKAYVPPEAIGFRISNSSVEVVDLGTEFTMVADGAGAADVLVLRGEVEAAPRESADQDTILLGARESRHFARSGVSPVADRDKRFGALERPVAFRRFDPGIHYLHWSFDEPRGDRLQAQAFGLAPGAYDMGLYDVSPGASAVVHSDGPLAHALRFDGQLYARAVVPGLSGNSPHTVAFWVKVPADASLSDAYAMVAWGKPGVKAVHIVWNRNPAEGPLGAIRTDFGGGSAIGTTPLRDGRWHHLAVVFAPGAGAGTPVQVEQYVDGKLESNTTNPPRRVAPVSTSKEEKPVDLTDILWLGCRLGITGQKLDRFRGEIDELFVADWGLEPNEIVQVMKQNRLLPPKVELARAMTGSDTL